MTIFLKLPPNSEHLSIKDNFFKTLRCPLLRGFTVFAYLKKPNGVSFSQEMHSFEKDKKKWNGNFKETLYLSHRTTNSCRVVIE